MSPIATTERLHLREMTPDDADHAFLLNSDPEVVRYTGDGPFASVEEARAFLAAYPDYRRHGFGRWAMMRTADDAWLGWCGLKRLEDGTVDLGYRLLREHWGRGYATEAAQASLELGFGQFGLETIVGRVAQGNIASIRVLEKLGMRYWKTDVCDHDPEALIYRIDRP
ncbi:MAG: GNAT family N-acetyltransferase [Flavobacteriales bacterium]|nr:GNAT family N-acetyltransferase [Flavobacteriales bacterium]